MLSSSSKHRFICINQPDSSFIIQLDGMDKVECTIQQLIDMAQEKYKSLNDKEILFRCLDDQLSRKVYNCILKFQPIYFLAQESSNLFKIIIKNLQGQEYSIQTSSNESVSEIKEKIKFMKNISCDEQRLIFAGKQLEDERKLSDYDIKAESKLCIVLRLRGGGSSVKFVDLENQSSKQEIQFSDNAPPYRSCIPGLNIEGRCINLKCPYYKKQVISQLGFTSIELISDVYDQILCPHQQCKMAIKPETCGFLDCIYSWSGIKKVDGQIIDVFGEQQEAPRNVYTRYDPQGGSNMATWKQLFIQAQIKATPVCPICQKEAYQSSTDYMKGCKDRKNHICHKQCILSICKSEFKECFICNPCS